MPKRETENPGNPGRLTTNAWEQNAGIKNAPDSARGATAMLSDGKRFYCETCRDLRKVIEVSNRIEQNPNAAIYQATLNCGHSRQIVLNVRRPKEVKEREENVDDSTSNTADVDPEPSSDDIDSVECR